ncbi:hypothetical protein M513_13880 [Trichuris suis]|uniref:Uncharacterized protein n=1 Tax=Trichuris suis TaxID=68888 RepID=A0A085LJU8_9BILA|nr:hypothetical protein M513_13880 [Trichuris suis]
MTPLADGVGTCDAWSTMNTRCLQMDRINVFFALLWLHPLEDKNFIAQNFEDHSCTSSAEIEPSLCNETVNDIAEGIS